MQKVIPPNSVPIPDHAKRVYEGVIFDVYQWQQELYDGSVVTFENAKRADTVVVLAIVDGKVLVVNDEQPNRAAVYSEPGGRIDAADASVLEAAQRELREETGYAFANWRLIGCVSPFPKIEYFIHTFLAWGEYEVTEPKHDSGEKITWELMEYADLKQLISDSRAPRFKLQEPIDAAATIDDLLATPEFVGTLVDRAAKVEPV